MMSIQQQVISELNRKSNDQRNFTQRQKDLRRKQVGFFVPEEVAQDFQLAADRCRKDSDLELLLRSKSTGRLVSL